MMGVCCLLRAAALLSLSPRFASLVSCVLAPAQKFPGPLWQELCWFVQGRVYLFFPGRLSAAEWGSLSLLMFCWFQEHFLGFSLAGDIRVY